MSIAHKTFILALFGIAISIADFWLHDFIAFAVFKSAFWTAFLVWFLYQYEKPKSK